MSLMKLVFKIVFKWLFSILASAEKSFNTESPYGDPSPGSNGNGRGQRKQNPDLSIDASVSTLKKSIQEFEKSLNNVADCFFEPNGNGTSNRSESISDLNELRAELAELKAEIRSIRHLVPESLDEGGRESES